VRSQLEVAPAAPKAQLGGGAAVVH